ncbi:MAG: hypothetical protein ACX939_06345 [Hyphococcus sp.]
MRYVVDLAVLVAVFAMAMAVFQNTVSALLAGLIIAGAGDAVLWDAERKKR